MEITNSTETSEISAPPVFNALATNSTAKDVYAPADKLALAIAGKPTRITDGKDFSIAWIRWVKGDKDDTSKGHFEITVKAHQSRNADTGDYFYDGDYIFFHYINQARYGGMYNEYKGGNHSALIAARGKGKSFKVASMTTRNFVLGENIDVSEKVKSVIVASNTEYLKKDGTLNKVMAMTDFLALNTQFPSSRLKSSTQEMHWVMG